MSAALRFARTSPRKARQVRDLLRRGWGLKEAAEAARCHFNVAMLQNALLVGAGELSAEVASGRARRRDNGLAAAERRSAVDGSRGDLCDVLAAPKSTRQLRYWNGGEE